VEESLRIVIVDDSQDFLRSARAVLENEGAIVEGMASTGAEALQLVEALRPNVVLVDVHLGEESGFDVAERVVAAFPTPVVLISAYRRSELSDFIAASPAVGFVPKEDLSVGAVSRLLDGARGSGAPAQDD
jgi:CheY-like chemotaxis protein